MEHIFQMRFDSVIENTKFRIKYKLKFLIIFILIFLPRIYCCNTYIKKINVLILIYSTIASNYLTII